MASNTSADILEVLILLAYPLSAGITDLCHYAYLIFRKVLTPITKQ